MGLLQNPTMVVIHCSATPEGRNHTVEDFYRWHVIERGWADIGYHYIIDLDNRIIEGRSIEKDGAHTFGFNNDTIGICYVGGMDAKMTAPKDTLTDGQAKAMLELLLTLKTKFPTLKRIAGHNEFSNKACPSFKVADKFPTDFKDLHHYSLEEKKPTPLGSGDPWYNAAVQIKFGDFGPLVVRLQRALNVVTQAGLTVDGDFGPRTHTAMDAWVRRFGSNQFDQQPQYRARENLDTIIITMRDLKLSAAKKYYEDFGLAEFLEK